jgi:crotonobetaine/carnitine-CoA ligase
MLRAELGNKPLIRTPDAVLTYAEAPRRAARVAGVLAGAGVRPGNRVVAFLSNSVEFLELWFGVTWLGAALAPINTAFRGEQLRHMVRVVDPVVIVTEELLLPHLCAISSSFAEVRTIFVVDYGGPEPGALGKLGDVSLETFTSDAQPVDAWPVEPSDTAAILYTSGTTGPSKGVVCPHAQFYWWGTLTAESLEITSSDVLFTVLPLFHTNALNTVCQALLNGATVSFRARFSASAFWEQCRQTEASVIYLLGAMVEMLLKQTPSELGRRHGVRVALSPATSMDQVRRFRDRFGVTLVDGYGSTETNLVLSNVIGGYAPGTMGRVVDGFEVRVVDDMDCDVEDGKPGELLVRHREPFSMAGGYLNDPEATLQAWRNLWFHTGDQVIRDPDGSYRFVDRIADTIRRRGENISSWEVEQALATHPSVARAAVVGVPSELGEQDVMAFIVQSAGCRGDPAEITVFLESRLAAFAIPRYVKFVAELPVTENGKVKKHLLRAEGATGNLWDRERAGHKVRKVATHRVP